MENKIKKWENQYESYINGEKKQRLEELKSKLGKNKGMTKQEYEEYNKMVKVQENLPNIKNLLDCQRNLIKAKTLILKELKQRENLKEENKNYGKEQKNIEDELAKINDKKEKINLQLKNKDLSKEERFNLQSELAKCENEIQVNNEKYLKHVESQPTIQQNDSVFAKFTDKQLKDKVLKLSVKMDVCNLYINRLMKGQEIEHIREEEKNINWDRDEDYKKKIENEIKNFKLPKEQKEKMENLKEVAKEEEKVIEEKIETKVEQNEVNNPEEALTEENTQKALIEVSEFDQKHPRLAAIKNWFKQKFGKKVQEEKEESKEEPVKDEATRRSKFLKDLKFIEDVNISKVAEKGINETRREEKIDAKKRAMQTLIENKRKAGEGKDGGTADKLQSILDEYEGR